MEISYSKNFNLREGTDQKVNGRPKENIDCKTEKPIHIDQSSLNELAINMKSVYDKSPVKELYDALVLIDRVGSKLEEYNQYVTDITDK